MTVNEEKNGISANDESFGISKTESDPYDVYNFDGYDDAQIYWEDHNM